MQEPLRMVNAYTQLLLRRPMKDDPDAIEYGRIIQDAVKRMENLIRDLLTFSRTIQSDEHTAGEADLNECLAEAMLVM
ncbi:histidine kinase dimerization/phospho-acceptor domain-containing protein, partial [Staphylococcus aureus]